MEKLPHSMNDQLLIDLLRQRNKEAFKLLFDKYAVGIYGLLLDILAHPEPAAKALQSTFKTAYDTIEGYDHSKLQLFAWLLHIARSNAIQLLHANETLPAIEVANQETGLRSLLRHIPAQQRQVLELMYYHGHNKQRVGEILTLSPETVASLFSHGMQLIRDHLSKIQQAGY